MNIPCIHIETGIKGTIKSELAATDKFPAQYGIHWSKEAYKRKAFHLYYWNDKTKITKL